jgi:hypothetical protein
MNVYTSWMTLRNHLGKDKTIAAMKAVHRGDEYLLPEGSKLQQFANGELLVKGSDHDGSDVEPYRAPVCSPDTGGEPS